MYGELIPLGGGDPIPLLEAAAADRSPRELRHHLAVRQRLGPPLPVVDRERLLVRPRHAEPQRHQGERREGDRAAALAGRHRSRSPSINTASTTIRPSWAPSVRRRPTICRQEIMKESLLPRAGLDHRDDRPRHRDDGRKRYDPTNHAKGQIKLPDDPV